jgi:hypothetical protein
MTVPRPEDSTAVQRRRRLQRILEFGLFAILVLVSLRVDAEFIRGYPVGVDADIPLRAADRWLAGGQVYLPESFEVTGGRELPFLYPPFVLPLLGPLAMLPRIPLLLGWLVVTASLGVLAARRMGLGWGAAVIVLAWPPFLEALLGGNVQLLLVAAFVTLLWRRPGPRAPFAANLPQPVDLRASGRPLLVDGVLASIVGAVKVSQLHAWFHLLARRPLSALGGAAVVAGLGLATLPLVGLDLWFDWLGQAARSGDPAWKPVGYPLSVFIGREIGLAVTALTVVGALLVRGPRAGAWIGVLIVVGAPSLHLFGLLFTLPALLTIRRDVALVAAMAIATGGPIGIWTGVGMAAAGLAFEEWRQRASSLADVAGSRPAARSAIS